MEKKLVQGQNSSYQITVSFTDAEKAGVKNTVLEHFAKDMNIPGFRAGKAPLHMVEQKMQAAYIAMAINEHLINKALQELLKENQEIKFIGEPYAFDTKEDKGVTTVTFALDVYPEVEVKGKKWEAVKMDALQIEATEQEIEDSLLNIQKNYADYKDTDVITAATISKLGLEFFDKDGQSIEKGTTYLGEAEFSEDKFWAKTFEGQKKADVVELKYDEKKLPEVLKFKKGAAAVLKVTVVDIKEIVLPELNDEMIVKLFGKDAEVKTNAELRAYIQKEILKQKQENGLVQTIENYLDEVKKTGVEVHIPKTMVDQEVKVRLQNLEKRFGSAEKVQEYFKQLGEEKSKEFIEGIQTAAAESLQKFFILNKVTELLGLTIDWNNEQEPLFVEKQLYAKLVGELPTPETSSTKKTPTKKASTKTKKSE
ncbi:MAG: trigger factor [bacterium]|nr:trigger factor [bacterium]